MIGRVGSSEKSRNCSTWTRIRSTQPATTSAELSARSALRPLGSPIRPVAPPTRPSGTVARPLEAAQGQQLDQVADVQRRRGRVEAAIDRDRTLGERRAQGVDVGGLRDQAAPREVIENVGHDPCFPMLEGTYTAVVLPCPITASFRHPKTLPRARRPAGMGGCAYRRRGTCGRYGETVGSPSIQKRQGVSLRRRDPRARPGHDRSRRRPVHPPVRRSDRAHRRRARCAPGEAECHGQPCGPAGEVAFGDRTARAARSGGPGPPRCPRSPPRPAAAPPTDALGQADQVGTEVHAVGEIDVQVPGRPEHHRVAGRPAAIGVGGGVLARHAVRLDLGQPHRDRARPAGRASTRPSRSGATSCSDRPVEEGARQRTAADIRSQPPPRPPARRRPRAAR